MIGPIITGIKVLAVGATVSGANHLANAGINMASTAAAGAAKKASSEFIQNNSGKFVTGILTTLWGVGELLAAKWAFHDHADVTVKALGLESVYESVPAKDANAKN